MVLVPFSTEDIGLPDWVKLHRVHIDDKSKYRGSTNNETYAFETDKFYVVSFKRDDSVIWLLLHVLASLEERGEMLDKPIIVTPLLWKEVVRQNIGKLESIFPPNVLRRMIDALENNKHIALVGVPISCENDIIYE